MKDTELKLLFRGVDEIIPKKEFHEKLNKNRSRDQLTFADVNISLIKSLA